MKKAFLFSLVLTVILSLDSFAQPRFNLEDKLKNLREELELTDSQAVSIEKILREQFDELQELRDSFDGDRHKMMTQMRSLRDVTDERIKGILNNQQQKQYEKFVEENRKKMRGNRGRMF